MSLHVSAQYMNRTAITKDQGLPGDEIYNLAIGNNEIWISVEGTNICRWNGYKLTCYDRSTTGLETPTVRLHYEYGILHLYEHGVEKYLIFQNDNWEQIEYNEDKKTISENTLFQDTTGTIRRLVWDGENFEKVDWNFETEFDPKDSIDHSLSSSQNNLGYLIIENKNGNTSVIETPDSLSVLQGAKYLGSQIFQKVDGNIVHLSPNNVVNPLPIEIQKLRKGSVMNSDEMLISHEGQFAIFDLINYQVADRLYEQDLGYFYKIDDRYYSHSHNGLVIRNKAIHFYEGGKDDMVRSTHIVGEDDQGAIWFGGYKSGYTKYHNDKMTKVKFDSRTDNALTARLILEDGSLIFVTENYNHVLHIKDGEIAEKKITYGNHIQSTAYDSKILSDNTIGFGGYKYGLGLVAADRLFTDSIRTISTSKGFDLQYVFCLTEDANQRIWSASQQEGLAIYDRTTDKARSFLVADSEDRYGITSLTIDSLDNLWIGSFDGLYILENVSTFDYETRDPYSAMKKVPLTPFEGNTTAVIQYDSLMVVAAEKEVYFINLNQYYSGGSFDAYTYSYKYDIQGGASEENGTLIDSKGNLWIGTQEGYLEFEMKEMEFDTTSIDLYLDEVIIAKKTIEQLGNTIDLPAENRNFIYSYNIKSNSSLRNNIYTYSSLLDSKGDTLFTELYDPVNSNNQFFLEPGEYTLVADTYKNNRLIDQDIYQVNAQSFLTEKIWFWPSVLGFTFLLFLYTQKQKSKREKLILEKDLQLSQLTQAHNQTQLQAIISSFNPHFINNSLHWAQSRYHEDKTLVKVIGRLSENIQHIFLKTKHGRATHSLQEELRLVENYILIQQVRFKDSFEYIPPDTDIVEKCKEYPIPIMQLQIHVENAIEHGLRNKVDSTYVQIKISYSESEIEYQIIDDGVGRIAANKMGSKGTQSGVSMLNQVHEIFNSINKNKISQTYEDNHVGDHGTKVIITIPKKYNYEF